LIVNNLPYLWHW